MKVLRETEVSLAFDGGNNVGMLALFHAAEATIKKTAAHGVALVSVTDAWMSGRGAYYVEMIAKHGLVAIYTAASSPLVAPPGGIRPALGTNPIAIAVPSSRGPIVLDMGTSAYMMTEVMLRERLGELLPDGVALGPGGEPTRDPTAARRGALLPFGGYKGFGLALMMQALGLLAGSGLDVESEYGYLFAAFRARPLWASRRIRATGDAADRAHQGDATAARRRPHPHSVRAGISLSRARTPRGPGDRPGGIRCACRTARAVRSAGAAYLPTCGFQKFPPVGFARPGRITSRPRARVPGTALSPRGLLCSHREHRRAHGLARLQVAMRLCGLFQRIGLLDLNLDCAREHHLEEILCHRREIGTGGSEGV